VERDAVPGNRCSQSFGFQPVSKEVSLDVDVSVAAKEEVEALGGRSPLRSLPCADTYEVRGGAFHSTPLDRLRALSEKIFGRVPAR
jgi:hypothetical protein